ncbi:F-box only protein 32-like isoform X3 [Eriocheir sinensis]|uniref:F-box only protein 32-like isoform X3 n=1 Tax=Eriocheir sinensis TaxID=95602 RepID=UPI0021C84210|nr:F-box only protein 32-like isoform X3 [Eriocheir sinensis]
MPIFSKDWRDPGDRWVKTNGGWEKEKVAGFISFPDEDTASSLEDPEPDGPDPLSLLTRRGSRGELVPQPHCRIYTRNTKEVAGFNGLGETLMKLDCINAVRDIRRFRYICKLLDLLITQKLSTLSGGAQKMLFGMLEEVAHEVTRSQQNVHLLQHLLQELRKRLEDYLWGNKLGSTILWEQHSRRLRNINAIATTIQIREPGDDMHPTLQEVPEECVREILKRLDNHNDIRSAGEAYSVMAKVSKEKSIWRQLCRFHWTSAQIEYIIHLHRELRVQKNWQQVYDRLRRTYGLREEYPEKLCLCRNCSCMFWESYGHPCRNDQGSAGAAEEEQQQQPPPQQEPQEPQPQPQQPQPQQLEEVKTPDIIYITITPQQFLKYFHL